MLRVTLRGLQGHLVRLLLTAFAVMLGVSFVAGTFVLRDSINNALGSLLSSTSSGVDVSVRGTEIKSDGAGTGTRPPVPLSLVKRLSKVAGVARVSPDLQGTALIAGRDGTVVRNSGAPGLGFAFAEHDPSWSLVAGRGPTGPGEVAVETATLAKANLHVGDRTKAVLGGRTSTVRITGEVHFRSETLFGATAVLVDPATARRLFSPDGSVPSISITAQSGVNQAELRTDVAEMLPAGDEAVTGAAVQAENETAVKQGVGFVTTFLLAFAGLALFVGAFIIVNTFSMLIGQRAREFAMLRALGASRGQILRVVIGEAAVVGVVGSGLGILLGIAIAQGAKSALKVFLGVDIGASLPVNPATILWSVAVGTIVTVISAVLPARRAARTAPVAAMRGDAPIAPQGLRRRGLIGLGLLVAGAALLTSSVIQASVPWMLAAVGVLFAVLGMLVAAPFVARPVVRVIAWPFVAVGGVVGKLARQNALRVPRRTAATASALMIGLALVAGISVLASSVKASITEGVSHELTSDFVLNGGTSAVPSSVAVAARSLPGVQSVAAFSLVDVHMGTFATSAEAITATALADNFVVTMHDGNLKALANDAVLVDQTTATAHGWHVGDVLDATVGTLEHHKVTVGGIYNDSQAFASHLIVARALYAAAVPIGQQADLRVFLKAAPGADLTRMRSQLVGLVKPYLVVSVQNGSEFATAQGAQINIVLNLLYVLLLFSIVIAVLGIINTLALSVLERTREIGLLRAIGLRRRQLSGMITIEAIATAVFGAVLGTLLGLGLGIAFQRGLQSQGLNTLGIPWVLIAAMLLSSMIVGILAAALPAIRAVRLNILESMAHT
jgi:putative ABC transport system permease protein